MFTHFKIIHKRDQLYKIININDFSIGDLELISNFYDEHDDYELNRIIK